MFDSSLVLLGTSTRLLTVTVTKSNKNKVVNRINKFVKTMTMPEDVTMPEDGMNDDCVEIM